MPSLEERVDHLGQDILADPMRISAYHDLPFTILRYDPSDEYPVRNQVSLLARRLENAGRRVSFISLARLLWRAIEETEGVQAILTTEKELGFSRAQRTVSTLLSDPEFFPLPIKLVEEFIRLEPSRDVVFLVRAGTFAPTIYRCAKLLDELHGRTMVPVILLYPGSIEGTTSLRFMNMKDREDAAAYSYRVKIY
jgi:hypothetical protein